MALGFLFFFLAVSFGAVQNAGGIFYKRTARKEMFSLQNGGKSGNLFIICFDPL
jgi:hypothetical protein